MGPEETHDPTALEQWFGTWEGPIVSKSHDLEVAVGGDIASFAMDGSDKALLDLTP